MPKSDDVDDKPPPVDDAEIDRCYKEIDQIYDYVRGFAPLPESVKKELAANRAKSKVDSANYSHRRLSYPTIVHFISASNNKRPLPAPGMCFFSRQPPQPPTCRAPMRSNSTGKIGLTSINPPVHREPLLPTVQLGSKPKSKKLFVKSQQSKSSNRMLRYARSPTVGDVTAAIVCPKILEVDDTKLPARSRSNRSLSTSPLFNIRYKSLNNLHLLAPKPPSSPPPLLPPQVKVGSDDWGSPVTTDTLDSSGSGTSRQQSSSSSGGSKEQPKPKSRKLSRPKSLTNLFWDMAAAITFDRVHHSSSDKASSNNLKSSSPARSGSIGTGSPPAMSIERVSPDTMPYGGNQRPIGNRLCKSSSMSAVVVPNSTGHSHCGRTQRKLGTLYL